LTHANSSKDRKIGDLFAPWPGKKTSVFNLPATWVQQANHYRRKPSKYYDEQGKKLADFTLEASGLSDDFAVVWQSGCSP
jgi:hypothetical protein